MIAALAALGLILSVPSQGAEISAVRRGNLVVKVKVAGTVVPDDIFRLKSTIEGRVESVMTSSYTWRGADQTLAFLAHKELAAMIDSKGSQSQELMEDRWQRVYRPTPIRCPDTCFVLKVFAKARSWVKPQAVLFEAAAKLKMVARVRPEDAHWVKDGQMLTFWSLKDPKKTYQGRVTRYILDVQGQKVEPGGSFVLDMSPSRYFDPGTDWEGEIVAAEKKDVLTVPTAALIQHGGAVYLPVRVSTGITTASLTQITSGAAERHEVLVIDDEQLKDAQRHKQTVDRAALERRREELEKNGQGRPADMEETRSQRRQPSTLDERDYGDDPYGDL
ncbi:MAG: hypothetical protein A2506_00035 [Elusimicrobia bacterium RIFOXYD12_FULL_66_9]|nr:MAG: hypothetical protein A2506_00035 [Elusimicrobia bacterium RIFOXYD12_FULL_66_9]